MALLEGTVGRTCTCGPRGVAVCNGPQWLPRAPARGSAGGRTSCLRVGLLRILRGAIVSRAFEPLNLCPPAHKCARGTAKAPHTARSTSGYIVKGARALGWCGRWRVMGHVKRLSLVAHTRRQEAAAHSPASRPVKKPKESPPPPPPLGTVYGPPAECASARSPRRFMQRRSRGVLGRAARPSGRCTAQRTSKHTFTHTPYSALSHMDHPPQPAAQGAEGRAKDRSHMRTNRRTQKAFALAHPGR